jgi:hypothetical protein
LSEGIFGAGLRAMIFSIELAFSAHHIRELRELIRPHLSPEIPNDFERLACPESNSYLLD